MHENNQVPIPLAESQKEVEDYSQKRLRKQKIKEDELLNLIEQGDSLGAIRLVRKSFGMSLIEAKEFVDEMAGLNETAKDKHTD